LGNDISSELNTRTKFLVPEPAYPQSAQATIQTANDRRDASHKCLSNARKRRQAKLEANKAPLAKLELAELLNKMAEADYQATLPVKTELEGEERTWYHNEFKTSTNRKANLEKHREQTFALIFGQCSQLLVDKMKHDRDHDTVMRSADPLKLYALIEKTIMAQIEDKYPFETIYNSELRFYNGQQRDLSNDRFYNKFNTQSDVNKAVGIERIHPTLVDYMTEQPHKGTAFEDLPDANQELVKAKTMEAYLSYAFLQQAHKQHAKLKTDLRNEYAHGIDKFPKDR
jgi:hypothetical protein